MEDISKYPLLERLYVKSKIAELLWLHMGDAKIDEKFKVVIWPNNVYFSKERSKKEIETILKDSTYSYTTANDFEAEITSDKIMELAKSAFVKLIFRGKKVNENERTKIKTN